MILEMVKSKVNLEIIKQENPKLYAKIIKRKEYLKDYMKNIKPIKG